MGKDHRVRGGWGEGGEAGGWVLEASAEEVDVGRLPVGAAGGLAHDRGARRTDDLDEQVGVDLAGAEVLVPVAARAGRVLGVVGVDEVDPAGDRQHAFDDADEVLAARVRVAGVEAEADVVDVSAITSQSRASASNRRAIAWSPPAVFSMSTGTVDSSRSNVLRQLSKPDLDVVVGADVPAVDDHRRARRSSRRHRALVCEDLAAGDADLVVGARRR